MKPLSILSTLCVLSRRLLILGTALLLCSLSVQAQEYDNRGSVYGGLSHYIFDDDWEQDNDTGFFLGGEVPLSGRWSLLLEHWNLDSDYELANVESDIEYNRFGANYYLNSRDKWQPYLSLGAGSFDYDNPLPGIGDNDFALDLGIGTKYFFNDNFFARGDLKAVRVWDADNLDLAINLGIGWAFGRKSSAPAAARTPAPQAPAVTARQPQQETDSDMDGVMDSRDRCANTPRDLAVDSNGCPIMESHMMSQELMVNFDTDKSDIKPQYDSEIRDFADFMRTYGNTSAVIEGHTDSDGTEAYNQGLSERRANAVMNELISKYSIPASRLSAVGYGEARPLVPNTSAANKARNRRIMAEISVEVQEQKKR